MVSSSSPAPKPASRPSDAHALIWIAVLVWVSVETIGDGLLALRSLLTNRSDTPTSTPS